MSDLFEMNSPLEIAGIGDSLLTEIETPSVLRTLAQDLVKKQLLHLHPDKIGRESKKATDLSNALGDLDVDDDTVTGFRKALLEEHPFSKEIQAELAEARQTSKLIANRSSALTATLVNLAFLDSPHILLNVPSRLHMVNPFELKEALNRFDVEMGEARLDGVYDTISKMVKIKVQQALDQKRVLIQEEVEEETRRLAHGVAPEDWVVAQIEKNHPDIVAKMKKSEQSDTPKVMDYPPGLVKKYRALYKESNAKDIYQKMLRNVEERILTGYKARIETDIEAKVRESVFRKREENYNTNEDLDNAHLFSVAYAKEHGFYIDVPLGSTRLKSVMNDGSKPKLFSNVTLFGVLEVATQSSGPIPGADLGDGSLFGLNPRRFSVSDLLKLTLNAGLDNWCHWNPGVGNLRRDDYFLLLALNTPKGKEPYLSVIGRIMSIDPLP